MHTIEHIIANELSISTTQVENTIKLLDDGSTVPFIARYRKEVTGSLTDIQLRDFEKKLKYLREIADRKQTIIDSIKAQNKLTDEIIETINNTWNKAELEDIYLPFKPKRRTKGQIAIEQGLLPLANDMLSNFSLDPQNEALNFINEFNQDIKAVLNGAKYIIIERLSEANDLLLEIRKVINRSASISSKIIKDKELDAINFKDYFDFKESIQTIPSHRMLAILRGRNQNMLSVNIVIDSQEIDYCQQLIKKHINFQAYESSVSWWNEVVLWTFNLKIFPHLETEIISLAKQKAENEAIDIFAKNLKELLLSPPATNKKILGIDPGFRTGCKLALIDEFGNLKATNTIFPLFDEQNISKSKHIIKQLFDKFGFDLVAIGNGTASRETSKFVDDFLIETKINAKKIIVSEAGASIYSASEFASNEFPDIDVSLRGSISIARRLQDPLAELVKIDPKSIGIGQYQHDVSSTLLQESLDNVIEDCVNSVGVDVNTASKPLLERVSGLSASVAENIIKYRSEKGMFTNRTQFLEVHRLGNKAFEQAAGFLRINSGDNVLDKTALHPESYGVVKKIANALNISVNDLLNNQELNKLNYNDFKDECVGNFTFRDIIAELSKPGRDPRGEFKSANFDNLVNDISELKKGFITEGVVTNITSFGAFVDIGVHHDGLLHISGISDYFIKDIHQVIKNGDILNVVVEDVDISRNRISLSLVKKFTNNQKRQPRNNNIEIEGSFSALKALLRK